MVWLIIPKLQFQSYMSVCKKSSCAISKVHILYMAWCLSYTLLLSAVVHSQYIDLIILTSYQYLSIIAIQYCHIILVDTQKQAAQSALKSLFLCS